MLTLYCGRENIDKEAFMFARIDARLESVRRDASEPVRSVLLLVPDQFTLQAERDAFACLKRDGFMEFEVLSPSRLRLRVFGEVGGDTRVPIDRSGRHMLISLILRREAERFEAFRGLYADRTFAESVNDFISELKFHNIAPDDLRRIRDREDEPALRRKLSDLLLIYTAYEDRIRGKYLDGEDSLGVFTRAVARSRLIRDAEIWMYGFDSLGPKELDVTEALVKAARAVNVVLTADLAGGARDRSLFRGADYLISALRRRGGDACRVTNLNTPGLAAPLDAPPALRHLERECFAYPHRPYRGGPTPELAFTEATDYYAEAESVASEILSLVRDEGYRYRDILVICNDTEERAAVIRHVFSDFDLPVFMDLRRNISTNPVLEYISSLLRIVSSGRYAPDEVIALIKTGMTPVEADACELLELYVRRMRIRGRKAWSEPFTRTDPYERAAAPDTPAGEAAARRLETVNAAREAIAGHIARFVALLSEDRGVAGRTKALWLFLRDHARIPEKLTALVEAFREKGRHEYADELAQVWDGVTALFDQTVAILGDEKISREDYAALLSAGLEGVEIGLIPATSDRILVGTMLRTRAGRVRALFVMGANDGVLPARASGSSLFGDDEQERLFREGRAVSKPGSLKDAEEALAIYRNLSMPSERLRISFSLSDAGGGELRPSVVAEKLMKLFPDRPVRPDVCRRESPLDSVMSDNAPGLRVRLAAALRGMADGRVEDESGVWRAVFARLSRRDPDGMAPLESGLFFAGPDARLDRARAASLYASRDGALVLSPSRLERYARCPFSHFVEYGLRPREERVAEVGSRERGELLHRVLMAFSRSLTETGVNIGDADSEWARLTEEACAARTDAVFAELIERPGARDAAFAEIFKQGDVERYRCERIRRVARTAAWMLVSQVRAGLIEAMYFEEGFGEGRRFPALACATPDGAAVRIEGRIDRVDVLRGGFARIIDYKSGGDKFDAEAIKSGRNLQLMLYLQAVTDGTFSDETLSDAEAPIKSPAALRPAGVFYFKLAEPSSDSSAWAGDAEPLRSEKAARAIRGAFRLDGVAVDDQAVLEALVGRDAEEGNSDVFPVKITRDADGRAVYTKTNAASRRLLDEQAFDELRRAASENARAFCAGLAGGIIGATPRRHGAEDACRYCRFLGICGHDVSG